jgi:large subunit ribosomal protein L25
MASSDTTTLSIKPREIEGSRTTRRLRREGLVPGVLYGRGGDPLPFAVDARELRHALHASGAVIELSLDGESTPAVLKDAQHHPVRGETTHVDFLRVDLTKPIEAVVALELDGAEDCPGVRDGGVVDHTLREVRVEALPSEIPEALRLDVSELSIGDTLALSVVAIPSGVKLIDDPESVAVSILAPRLQTEETEGIEEETELVGEQGGAAEAAGDAGEAGGDEG